MSKRKKVAILLPSMMIGGAERQVVEEVRHLKNDPRFALELHLVFDGGPFFEQVGSLGVPIRVWNAPHKSLRMLGRYAEIIRYLRRTRCDIVHSHLLDVIGPLVGRLSGARVVSTVHSDKPYRALERCVLAKSNLVLGCGEQVVRNVRSFLPAHKVALLNNAIGTPPLPRTGRAETFRKYGIREDGSVVLSLGRLTGLKGYDVLIRAFAQVVDKVPDAVLVIGGDGEERRRLEDLVRSEGVAEQVKLPGMVSDIHELLACCDLYVNSSRWEGLPMTLLEAMAHGKPMVATSVGGNPEVVRDGVTGMLVPPDDPDQLAAAIVRMLHEADLKERAGREALALFNSAYTIDRHCEALAGFYSQVTA